MSASQQERAGEQYDQKNLRKMHRTRWKRPQRMTPRAIQWIVRHWWLMVHLVFVHHNDHGTGTNIHRKVNLSESKSMLASLCCTVAAAIVQYGLVHHVSHEHAFKGQVPVLLVHIFTRYQEFHQFYSIVTSRTHWRWHDSIHGSCSPVQAIYKFGHYVHSQQVFWNRDQGWGSLTSVKDDLSMDSNDMEVRRRRR